MDMLRIGIDRIKMTFVVIYDKVEYEVSLFSTKVGEYKKFTYQKNLFKFPLVFQNISTLTLVASAI